MVQVRRSLLGGMALLVLLLTPAMAAGREAGINQPIDFDIQAQPLAAALVHYGDLTGREVFYQGQLVEGRISNPVQGHMGPLAALTSLLEGTGLQARFLDDGSFMLSSPFQGIRSAALQYDRYAAQRYYGQIQAAIHESFCRRGLFEPGTFRAAALIWIGPGGDIAHVEQLSSTGILAMDQNIETAFLSTRLQARPPAAFAQPALIMIVPQTGSAVGCGRELGQKGGGQR